MMQVRVFENTGNRVIVIQVGVVKIQVIFS